MYIKEQIKKIPIIGGLARRIYWQIKGKKSDPVEFIGSQNYWEKRYASGGNSGVGSYDEFANFKAQIINNFIDSHAVHTIIEFGCGDGNQLSLVKYPSYIGYDVSQTAIARCNDRFSTDINKLFKLTSEYEGETADLSLSLDVIYHLVEDDVYEHYMSDLFRASKRYVIIYASDTDKNAEYTESHVRHRKFTDWINDNFPNYQLVGHIKNRYPYSGDYETGSLADFFIYEKS